MIFYVIDLPECQLNMIGYWEMKRTPAKRGDFPYCPACHNKIGTKEWIAPFKVTLKRGKPADLCSDGMQFILSERFVDAWKVSGLTGLEFSPEPVEIVRYPKKYSPDLGFPNPPVYYAAFPKYVLTHLDVEASGLEYQPDEETGETGPSCDVCKSFTIDKMERLRIDESTWNGEDIFYPSSATDLIVSQRFHDFVEEHQFTNFHMIHQDDFFFDMTIHLMVGDRSKPNFGLSTKYGGVSAEDLTALLIKEGRLPPDSPSGTFEPEE